VIRTTKEDLMTEGLLYLYFKASSGVFTDEVKSFL